MVLVSGASAAEVPIYYKECRESRRSSRFCIKPVQTVAARTTASDKRADSVNVQVVAGKTTTFIHLDEDEARKVRQHGDYVLKKLQKIHKSVAWNFMVGRSFVDRLQKSKPGGPADEFNLDRDETCEFDAHNPRTWSDESLEFIGSILKATEFRYDGFVVLFCVQNDCEGNNGNSAAKVDYDELAWELEKCLTYHFIHTRSQLVMNEEACMSRQGLDPVSRKTKTPGRRKSGYCVYLAYQLLDEVTGDQMVGEALTKYVDIGQKKKQLLASLTEAKLSPQVDERLRKTIKEMKEFVSRDQLHLVHMMREVRDPEQLQMLVQFMTVLKSGKSSSTSSSGGGLLGLPQLLAFLNKSHEEAGNGSRMSSPRTGPAAASVCGGRSSTLPRPTSGSTTGRTRTDGGRKTSITSQTLSMVSSRSGTTPETPRKMSTGTSDSGVNGNGRARGKESSLASIPSSGSGSSTPETLRKQEHKASSSGKKIHPSGDRSTKGSRAVPPATPSPAQRRRPSGCSTRSVTPRGASSARSSVNGDSPSTSRRTSGQTTPSSSITNSPRMSTSTSGGRRQRPPPSSGKMITREDLRRMNKSFPSADGKTTTTSTSRTSNITRDRKTKPALSFSRTSIPMS